MFGPAHCPCRLMIHRRPPARCSRELDRPHLPQLHIHIVPTHAARWLPFMRAFARPGLFENLSSSNHFFTKEVRSTNPESSLRCSGQSSICQKSQVGPLNRTGMMKTQQGGCIHSWPPVSCGSSPHVSLTHGNHKDVTRRVLKTGAQVHFHNRCRKRAICWRQRHSLGGDVCQYLNKMGQLQLTT